MKSDIKKAWIGALRSGEYKQGTGELKTRSGYYCCLGVLTDLYCKESKVEIDTFTSKTALLPLAVQEWAGIRGNDVKVKSWGKTKFLSALNDNGKSFKTISNYIEKQL